MGALHHGFSGPSDFLSICIQATAFHYTDTRGFNCQVITTVILPLERSIIFDACIFPPSQMVVTTHTNSSTHQALPRLRELDRIFIIPFNYACGLRHYDIYDLHVHVLVYSYLAFYLLSSRTGQRDYGAFRTLITQDSTAAISRRSRLVSLVDSHMPSSRRRGSCLLSGEVFSVK